MIPRRDPPGRSPRDLQVSSNGPPRILPPAPPPTTVGGEERERERERNPKDALWLGEVVRGFLPPEEGVF